ncbi:MAG: UDP-N-acetylmuramoyl-L-alanyl-D-glutamate--2,6-diaminopimelate ligase [Sandaracinaceae bacterium]
MRTRGAPLGELHERGLALEVIGDPGVLVTGVRHDSRAVEPGDLFVAIPGRVHDGRRFAADAVARGAAAVAATSSLDHDVPVLRVADPRRALGPLAERVYGEPTSALTVLGVTGTNGKTTTAWLVSEALAARGRRAAFLGTVGSHVAGVSMPGALPTPEGDDLARFARRAVAAGASHLVMEVSSHALAQHRPDAMRFAVAAFTNLTQDHLDFHGTMEAYFEAKARLFTELRPPRAVIPLDGGFGDRLAARFDGVPWRVSRRPRAGADLDVRAFALDRAGIRATVGTPTDEAELVSPLVGAHNLDNLLVALGSLLALGEGLRDAADALGQVGAVPGRLERVASPGDEIEVIVDYAHTPDALGRALEALRPLTPGRLIAVFGCGGDRDRDKRTPMGRAGAAGADLVVLTSDNPRSEDPAAILRAIEEGVRAVGMEPRRAGSAGASGSGYLVEEDRREAIRAAVLAARPGDTVLVAGKGHEQVQMRGGVARPFDDRVEARAALAARRGGG